MTSAGRPGQTVRAAGVLFVARALVALALVFPATSTFSQNLRGFGGDRGLFAHGDLRALEALDFFRASIRSMVVGGSIFLVFASILELAPLAGVVSMLARPAPLGLAGFARAARRHFVGFTLLLGVVTLLEGIAFALGSLGAHALATRLFVGNDRTADLGAALAEVLALVPIVALGIAQDVARCSAVALDVGFYDAVTRAFVVLRARPLSLAFHYFARLVAAIGAIAFGVGVTLSVGMASPSALSISAASQVAVLLCLAFLRASWLAEVVSLESEVPVAS